MRSLSRTFLLAAVNLAVLLAFAALPGRAQSADDIPPGSYMPCCKTGTDAGYCCTNCCSKMTCSSSKQCKKPKAEE